MKYLEEFLSPQRRSVAPTKRAGSIGTAVYGGYPVSVEKNALLSGPKKWQTFSDIVANTSIVAAAVRYFLALVSKANWTVEPAEGGEEIAERVDEAIKGLDTPWRRIVRRAALFVFYGFSWQEWIAKKRDDGIIVFLDIEQRPQVTVEKWDMFENGKVAGVWQRNPQTSAEQYIPRAKSVYLVDDSLTDNPEGLGLLRHCVEPAQRLKRYEQLEGQGFETDLRGIAVGRAPITDIQNKVEEGNEDFTQADADAMLSPMLDFLQNHIRKPDLCLLLDSMTYTTEDEAQTPSAQRQWDVELLKGGNTTQEAVAAAIQRLMRELARLLGCEHLLLGESGAGSLAMAKDKSQTFAVLVASTLQHIAEAFNKDIVEPLMTLNGWDMAKKPTLKPDAIDQRDIEEVCDALEKLARAGAPMTPDDPAVLQVRDRLGLQHPNIDTAMAAFDAALQSDPVDEDEPIKDNEDEG